MQVSEDWNPDVDFSAYQSFALLEEEEPRPADQQLFAARVVDAIESVMREKGLRMTQSDPDLLISWDAATEGKMSVSTYGTSYGGGYGRYRRGRGGWGGGVSYSTTSVDEWTEGTLVIEIIDARIEELVFTASAQAKLHENQSPEDRTDSVNRAIAKILDKFPPGN
jgi:hypothetical protein